MHSNAMTPQQVDELLERGRQLGVELGSKHQLVALGEVGIGNTTVAAALAAGLLGISASDVVGLGASSDAAMLSRKAHVVRTALHRVRHEQSGQVLAPQVALEALGGPEFVLLAGVILGAAAQRAVVVLDGLATSVAAVVAVALAPGAAAYLVAGQRSREQAHMKVLEHLGLEPLLDLRLRAGEGVGAALAASLLLTGLSLRAAIGQTIP